MQTCRKSNRRYRAFLCIPISSKIEVDFIFEIVCTSDDDKDNFRRKNRANVFIEYINTSE